MLNLFSIDNPLSGEDCFGFLYVRCQEPCEKLHKVLAKYMQHLQCYPREGYGYGYSTYSVVDFIFRISVGLEANTQLFLIAMFLRGLFVEAAKKEVEVRGAWFEELLSSALDPVEIIPDIITQGRESLPSDQGIPCAFMRR